MTIKLCECGGAGEPDIQRAGPQLGLTLAMAARIRCDRQLRCPCSTAWHSSVDRAISVWNFRKPKDRGPLRAAVQEAAGSSWREADDTVGEVLRILEGEA